MDSERRRRREEDREIAENREIGVEGLKEIRRLKGKVERVGNVYKDEW